MDDPVVMGLIVTVTMSATQAIKDSWSAVSGAKTRLLSAAIGLGLYIVGLVLPADVDYLGILGMLQALLVPGAFSVLKEFRNGSEPPGQG